jgi:hypothetical protein
MWTDFLAFKYDCINKNVDGKYYSLPVPTSHYITNMPLAKSNIPAIIAEYEVAT